MNKKFKKIIKKELFFIKKNNFFKNEKIISSKQNREITINKKKYLNFCSNNYLGLASKKELTKAAKEAVEKWGFGISSVRFICGTLKIHKNLEKAVSRFMGYQDAILYGSCYDANTAIFQAIVGANDAIISDELNHASLIDGVRLTKAERHIYNHSNMTSLEEKLKITRKKRLRLIVTDGVFSMEGDIAKMPEICRLAKKYKAIILMDDSHATGFLGKNGKGTHQYYDLKNNIDFITSTFGKALGGASGGFAVSTKTNIDFLRQKSRNYLFSNALPPVITAVNLFVIGYIQKHPEFREKLWENTHYFRALMREAGFEILSTEHPIVPIIIGDAGIAKNMAMNLLKEGIYVIGFSYPVVPEGKARIRVQISAIHTKKDIEKAVGAFIKVGRKFEIIK